MLFRFWRCLRCGARWDPRREPDPADSTPETPEEPGAPWRTPAGETLFLAPWAGATRSWAFGALAGIVLIVVSQDLSGLALLRAGALALAVVLLDAALTLRWSAVVLTPGAVRIERGDDHVDVPLEDLTAARTPEGLPYLESHGTALVAGPDAAAFLPGAMALRDADMERLWAEVVNRIGAR